MRDDSYTSHTRQQLRFSGLARRDSAAVSSRAPDPADYTILIRANSYYSFALLILLALGLVFELPVFVVGLVRIGVLTSTTLRRHRRLGYSTMAAPPSLDQGATAAG